MQNEKQQSYSGLIETVTFHNEENGFCVLKVKAEGSKTTTTLTGYANQVHMGQWVEATGEWIRSPKFGRQFQAKQLIVSAPKKSIGLEKFLASGLIKGIGPVYAKKLIQQFGDRVLEVIEHEPKRLSTVPGLGKKKIHTIVKSFEEQKEVHNIMVFLQSHGFGAARAMRIYRAYGKSAIEKITNNPYILAQDIVGIGFLLADQLAQSIGFEKDSPLRIQAGVLHAMQTLASHGHCAASFEQLVLQAKDLLQIDEQVVLNAIQHCIVEGDLILTEHEDHSYLSLPKYYYAEQNIAADIKSLLRDKVPPWGYLDQAQAEQAVLALRDTLLSEKQCQVLAGLLQTKVACLIGGPGVGKTTIIKSLLSLLANKGLTIALAAPTGRAAKRMHESTGWEAKTIHRLLVFDPVTHSFSFDRDNKLQIDCLIIDETSMVDTILMAQLLAAIPKHCAVIFVGDMDQLPSVGAGAVLFDLVNSDKIPVFHLTEIFRQAKDSQIIHAAHAVNDGLIPDFNNKDAKDYFYIEVANNDEALKKLHKILTERLEQAFNLSPVTEVQILSPMRKGPMGIDILNEEVKQWLNPNPVLQITRLNKTFGVGDKVIQTVNNYDKDVFNGDMGIIKLIDPDNKVLQIQFEDKLVDFDYSDLDDLQLAYAISIHKSQGSEYPAVIIPLLTNHYTMLARNLLYTAMTRGKMLVIILGQNKAIQRAVENKAASKRLTQLQYWLKD